MSDLAHHQTETVQLIFLEMGVANAVSKPVLIIGFV